MSDGCVHTTYDPTLECWFSYVESVEEGFGFEHSKDRAVELGRVAARYRKADHVIHDRSGAVAIRVSFRESSTG